MIRVKAKVDCKIIITPQYILSFIRQPHRQDTESNAACTVCLCFWPFDLIFTF